MTYEKAVKALVAAGLLDPAKVTAATAVLAGPSVEFTYPVWAEALADIRDQLAHLIYPGFLRQTPPEWLPHLPRYLRAIAVRLNKLRQAPDKDRQRSGDIIRLWEACQRQWERDAARERRDPELMRFRWLLEELRVSQFAQELKTIAPVSVKRLEEQWGRVKQR